MSEKHQQQHLQNTSNKKQNNIDNNQHNISSTQAQSQHKTQTQAQQQQNSIKENDYIDAQQFKVEQSQPQDEQLIEHDLQTAMQNKKTANQLYNKKQYSQALIHYRKALQYIDISPGNQTTQENKKQKSIIYANIGLTFMKMKQEDLALGYLQKSLKLNPEYTKARLNLAQCYENLQKPQQALEEYKKVTQSPGLAYDKFTLEKIKILQVKVKELQQKRKEQVMSGLKNIGNSILGFFGMSLDNFKLQQGANGGYNIQYKQ